MPQSSVTSFTDPDEYAAEFRGAGCQLTVTGRGRFNAERTLIDLHDLWVQRVSENLPRIRYMVPSTGRVFVAFRTQPGPSVTWRRLEIETTSLIVPDPAMEYYTRSSGPASLGSMSLPSEQLAAIVPIFSGRDLALSGDGLMLTSASSAMARLRRLHAAVGRLAVEAPALLTDPE